jgi:hypothetical protein
MTPTTDVNGKFVGAQPAPEAAGAKNMLHVCCNMSQNFEKVAIAQLSCGPSPGFC